MTVNDDEISVHQVQLMLQRQASMAPAAPANNGMRAVLDNLVEQTLAGQAARDRGLDRDPAVVQAIEAAKREALARAYQDRLAESATRPGTDDVERYYDSKPALFAQRRIYVLQELTLQATAPQVALLEGKLLQARSAGQAADAVKTSGVAFTAVQTTQAAEDLPLALLERLAALEEGRSLLLPCDGGAKVLSVLRSELSPIGRHIARPAIEAYLLAERKRELVAQGMKGLRDAARIEYQSRFALAPVAAASAPVQR